MSGQGLKPDWMELPGLFGEGDCANLMERFVDQGIAFEPRLVTQGIKRTISEFALYVRKEDAARVACILKRHLRIEDPRTASPFSGPCPACKTAVQSARQCPSCGLSLCPPSDVEAPLVKFVLENCPEEGAEEAPRRGAAEVTELADQPTVCPMCGADGSSESPGCGHCRPELRSDVMIRSRRDPAQQEAVVPVRRLTKMGFIASGIPIAVMLLGVIQIVLAGDYFTFIGVVGYVFPSGALLSIPAIAVNISSWFCEKRHAPRVAAGILALVHLAAGIATVVLVWHLFTSRVP